MRVEHLPDRTNMPVVALRFGERDSVQPGRDVAMNQHALDDLAQRRDVFGQRADFVRMRSQSAHGAIVLVVFLRTLHVFISCCLRSQADHAAESASASLNEAIWSASAF